MPVSIKKSQTLPHKKKGKKKKAKGKAREEVGILICDELDDDTIKAVWNTYEPGKDFAITLCSPGGEVTAYHALLDLLQPLREEGRLTTVALGQCQSGAPLIIAGGSPGKRLTYSSTIFSLHEPFLAAELPPDPGAQHEIFRHLEIIKGHYYEYLSAFTNHRSEWWRSKLEGRSSWTLSPVEVQKLGIVDEII
jgi:ATP-dependent protease ClpP protease subunit